VTGVRHHSHEALFRQRAIGGRFPRSHRSALPRTDAGERLYRVKGKGETFRRVANTHRYPALRCDV